MQSLTPAPELLSFACVTWPSKEEMVIDKLSEMVLPLYTIRWSIYIWLFHASSMLCCQSKLRYPIIYKAQQHYKSICLRRVTRYKLRDSASSFHWLSSSIFSGCCLSSRIGNISSHLHYMMFLSIQTTYFLWGYDPGNMPVPTYILLLSWAQFTVV